MRIVSTTIRACLLAILCTAPLRAETPRQRLEKLGAKTNETKGVLTQVQVDASAFTPDDYRALGQVTTLKKLSIAGKTFDDTTLPLLAGLVELEEISVDRSMLSDDGYRGFLAFPNLKSLSLFHPSWDKKDFTGAGLAHLQGLSKLERLTFAGATTGDEALAAVGRLTQLRDFRTWHTRQTQDGNKHLLNLVQLTGLRLGQRLPSYGKASPPSFDDTTLPLLAQIKTLQRVELTEARLTATGVLALKNLPDLKKISFLETDISTADVAALKAALPHVQIDHKPLTVEERELLLTKKLKL